LRKAITSGLAAFFDAHPEAKAVIWTQYTPYFNNGNTCVFRVNSPTLKVFADKVAPDVQALVEESDDERSEDGCFTWLVRLATGNTFGKTPTRTLSSDELALVADFRALGTNLTVVKDALLMMLGDHMRVTATRDGIDADTYDHD
jgi:hypothetical protein